MKKKILGAGTISIVLFCFVLVASISITSAYDIDGEEFTNRKPITIDNTGNANTLTDYQLKITVNHEPEMQPGFDDLRFTDSGGNVLHYWVEDSIPGTRATVWVKVTSIPGGVKTTMWMYYGNPSASSLSDGDATFDIFEDFDHDDGEWSEHDPNTKIELDYINDHRLKFNNWIRTDPGYVYKSCSAQNFVEEYEICITNKWGNANPIGPGFSDTCGTKSQWQNGVGTEFYAGFGDIRSYSMAFVDGNKVWGLSAEKPPHPNSIDVTTNTIYYVRLEKFEDRIKLSIFSDPARTAHIAESPKEVTADNLADKNFDYYYLVTGYTTFPPDNPEWTSGWMDNFRVRKYAEPEPTVEVVSDDAEPISEDDFSTDKSWTSYPGAEIIRNPAEENVHWHVDRNWVQYMAHSITPFYGDFQLKVDAMITDSQNNCEIDIGLTDDMGDVSGGGWEGLALKVGWTGGGTPYSIWYACVCGKYDDGTQFTSLSGLATPYENTLAGYVPISPGAWYSYDLTKTGSDWTLTVYDADDNLVGSLSGTLTGDFSPFKYVYFGNAVSSDWPSANGKIDNFQLSEHGVPEQPNVVITDISASPDSASPGDTVTITVDTHNNGAAGSADVGVTVWYPSDVYCNLQWQGYTFGEDESPTFTFQYSVPGDAELGSYNVSACAWDECTGTCAEQCCPDGLCSGRHNDGLEVDGVFEVVSDDAVPKIVSVEILDVNDVPTNTFTPGDTVRVKATISNPSQYRDYSVSVSMNIDDDTDGSNGVEYDSHEKVEDWNIVLPKDKQDSHSHTWSWVVPSQTEAEKTYYVAVGIHDQLNYYDICYDCPGYIWDFDAIVGGKKVLDVPYVTQGKAPWCLLASATMLLRYYGEDSDLWQNVDCLDWNCDDGLLARLDVGGEIVGGWIIQHPLLEGNYNFQTGDWIIFASDEPKTFGWIKDKINNNTPVIFFSFGTGHAVVIVGYDDRGEDIVYVNDPSGNLVERSSVQIGGYDYNYPFIKTAVKWDKVLDIKVAFAKFPGKFIFIDSEESQQKDPVVQLHFPFSGTGGCKIPFFPSDYVLPTYVDYTHFDHYGVLQQDAVHLVINEEGLDWDFPFPDSLRPSRLPMADYLHFKEVHITNSGQGRNYKAVFSIGENEYKTDPFYLGTGLKHSFGDIKLKLWNLGSGEYIPRIKIYVEKLDGTYSSIKTVSLPSLSIVPGCPFTATVFSPVDLTITDPDGFVINKESNEIPGAIYTETDINDDGDPDDIILILDRKNGDYQITVTPEPDAQDTDTYTLEIRAGDTTIVLAEDVQISEIPDQPYVVESTEEGIFIENQPPVADANGPYTGVEGAPITYNGSNSYDPDGSIVDYKWDFGDGKTGTGVSPDHTYAQEGTYTVTLVVNDGVLDSAPDATTATVTDTEPTADFNAVPTSGPEPLTVEFTDISSSYDGIASWSWDFGDGETSNEQNPTHTYMSSGTYNVSLTIAEADDDTATKEDYITVTPAGDAIPPVIESVTLDAYTTISDASIHVTVEATDNVGVTAVTADDVALVETGSTWDGDITAPSDTGDYTLAIIAEDAAENVAETLVDYSVVTPTGGLGVGISPRSTTASAGDIVNYNIIVSSTENFDDTIHVYVSMDGLPESYKLDMTAFEWVEQDVQIRAGEKKEIPLIVTIPAGETGRKVFRIKAESTRWTPNAYDSALITIT